MTLDSDSFDGWVNCNKYGKCPKILNTYSIFFGQNFTFYAVIS